MPETRSETGSDDELHCGYDPDDLLNGFEAGELLDITKGAVYQRWKAGTISFSVLLPHCNPDSTLPYDVRYYSKKEIEAIAKRDMVDPSNPDRIDWSEVISITGLAKDAVLDLIKQKDFPAFVRRGKKNARRYFFSRDAVLKWLGDHGEDIEKKGSLLNSAQACSLSGFSWPTLRKYIQSGDLHYAHYNPTPAKSKKAYTSLPGSPLGQGYWFTKKQILRFKEWLDKKMTAANRWENHAQRKGGASGFSTTSDPITSDPDGVKSQNVMLDEDIFSEFKDCSDKELTLMVLEAGEEVIYKALCQMTVPSPYDIYYLINSMQYGKKEWRHLDSGSKGQYSLKILRRAEEMICAMLRSGVQFKAYDLNLMLRTEVMIQEEKRRIVKTEVGQTGLSSDEILEAVAG